MVVLTDVGGLTHMNKIQMWKIIEENGLAEKAI